MLLEMGEQAAKYEPHPTTVNANRVFLADVMSADSFEKFICMIEEEVSAKVSKRLGRNVVLRVMREDPYLIAKNGPHILYSLADQNWHLDGAGPFWSLAVMMTTGHPTGVQEALFHPSVSQRIRKIFDLETNHVFDGALALLTDLRSSLLGCEVSGGVSSHADAVVVGQYVLLPADRCFHRGRGLGSSAERRAVMYVALVQENGFTADDQPYKALTSEFVIDSDRMLWSERWGSVIDDLYFMWRAKGSIDSRRIRCYGVKNAFASAVLALIAEVI